MARPPLPPGDNELPPILFESEAEEEAWVEYMAAAMKRGSFLSLAAADADYALRRQRERRRFRVKEVRT